MKECYVKMVMCSNCKVKQTIEIPKGVTIESYVKENKTCPECGCETLYCGMVSPDS